MSFESYTDCILQAFIKHTKPAEVLKKKQEILEGVAEFYNFSPDSVLYVGFNPAILVDNSPHISVTHISQAARDFLKSKGVKFNYIKTDSFKEFYKAFDVVIALDEYFTFAQSDLDQQNLVQELSNLAREYLITTCRDYKNQEFKEREFSIPALIRGTENQIFLEFHNYSVNDRNSWLTEVYHICKNNLNTFGPYNRRAMFFKQLAKFSSNAGSSGFCVHKNLMYKSLIKKNYEHVISIQFDQNGS